MNKPLNVYHVYDDVNDELTICESWDDVQSYASVWCERLNEEDKAMGDEQRYSVDTRKDIEAVFEVCNISCEQVQERIKQAM
ncbi:hypothetical protein [Staphylococcus equorum]|uniref:Uncharacterized protein n=1 Tax=Staphylococcus equorum TaxID=246432 RepID=A0AAP7LV20_9STAP|nr:hypothetical protein [Staphylococcus equorum]OEK59085.1 hypothetical protein ASS94_00025 [Staphylococcus equorum]